MPGFAIAAAALAAQATPAKANPVPSPPTPSMKATATRQQAFDAAAAAAERRDWEEALRQFDGLEASLAARGKAPRSLALVRLRRGEALLGLGRTSEAEASVRAGLETLPRDANLLEDRVFAQLILGEVAERRFDYPAAYREFAAAHADGAETSLANRALLGKLRSQTFVDSRAAAAAAQAAIAEVVGTDKAATERRAALRTLKGRALLNAGDFAGASAELERATRELGGGTTLRVSYSDLVARSDLALAALLAGRSEKAREYLAYTGAGRFEQEGGLPAPYDGKSPACGASTGLRPEDVAVVELALRDNGSVAFATPIYTSRPGTAAPFAASASQWLWYGDAIAKLPALIRLVTRVEMRCRQGSERPSIMTHWSGEHDRWAAPPSPAGSGVTEAPPLAMLQARLANAANLPTRLGLLKAIADHPSTETVEATRAVASAAEAARRGSAPASIQAYWQVRMAQMEAVDAKIDALQYNERVRAVVERIGRDPVIAGDPRARATLALLRADMLPRDKEDRDGEALLRGVIDDGALQPGDDLKIGARLRLARAMSVAQRHDEARRIYEAAALPADRCPVLDVGRAISTLKADSGDFPNEALRWGFEGWSQTETTIGPDGRATGARTVAAYPPFVFGKAAETINKTSRYQPSFRPAGDSLCGGQTQRVSFRLPQVGAP